MGWDASPRTNQDGPFMDAGYPYTPVLEGNTPEAFEAALRAARDFPGATSRNRSHSHDQRLE